MNDKRVQKLIEDTKASIAKTHDLVMQLEAVVSGENPTRDVIAFWCDEWRRKYGSDYDISKTDAGQFKRLVTKHGKVEMTQRIARYLLERRQWLVENKHPLSVFFKQTSSYATPGGDLGYEPPPSCQHEPLCRSDAEHTSKRMRELRA